MTDAEILIDLIHKKEKMVAMLAPSFPIVFPYPKIITLLRRLGFTYVAEVAAGAVKTNEQLLALYKVNPNARFITSPCPTTVRMVKSRMPQYAKYFPEGVDSPMVATAKLVIEKYPGYKPVFIGPCIVKKLETKEYPELNILALTFSELSQVLTHFGIVNHTDPTDHFDIAAPPATKIYPIDGGLSASSGLTSMLKETETRIVSGVNNIPEAIKEFDEQTELKLLDVLYCPGGCISGPGIQSALATEERKALVEAYAACAPATQPVAHAQDKLNPPT